MDDLRNGVIYKFSELWPLLLEQFMIRETNVKDICVELAAEGVIKPTWKLSKRPKPRTTLLGQHSRLHIETPHQKRA